LTFCSAARAETDSGGKWFDLASVAAQSVQQSHERKREQKKRWFRDGQSDFQDLRADETTAPRVRLPHDFPKMATDTAKVSRG